MPSCFYAGRDELIWNGGVSSVSALLRRGIVGVPHRRGVRTTKQYEKRKEIIKRFAENDSFSKFYLEMFTEHEFFLELYKSERGGKK